MNLLLHWVGKFKIACIFSICPLCFKTFPSTQRFLMFQHLEEKKFQNLENSNLIFSTFIVICHIFAILIVVLMVGVVQIVQSVWKA